jgi:hypothetical protein
MLERSEQDWTVGWSHGKEHFTDGTYDTAKGSFYISPYFASEQDNPNVYPPSLQPQLEERLMTMTRFMSKVGRWVGKLCDLYLQRESGSDIALDDPWTISKSLASGLAFKARLLFYPKTEHHESPKRDDKVTSMVVFDDWCGQHKDHGSITALLPGMPCEHNNSTITSIGSSAKQSDPFPPGLYVETRQRELVHASSNHVTEQISCDSAFCQGTTIIALWPCIAGSFFATTERALVASPYGECPN